MWHYFSFLETTLTCQLFSKAHYQAQRLVTPLTWQKWQIAVACPAWPHHNFPVGWLITVCEMARHFCVICKLSAVKEQALQTCFHITLTLHKGTRKDNTDRGQIWCRAEEKTQCFKGLLGDPTKQNNHFPTVPSYNSQFSNQHIFSYVFTTFGQVVLSAVSTQSTCQKHASN